MRDNQNKKAQKIETAGYLIASAILLAALIAGHIISNKGSI